MEEPEHSIFSEAQRSAERDSRFFGLQITYTLIYFLISAIASWIIVHNLGFASEQKLCNYASKGYLANGWPPNSVIVDSIRGPISSSRDKCLYVLSLSSTGYLLLAFSLIAALSRSWSKDNYYVAGMVWLYLVFLICGLIFAYTPMSDSYAKFGLTSKVDIYSNIVRSSVNVFVIYFSLNVLIFRGAAWIRSQ